MNALPPSAPGEGRGRRSPWSYALIASLVCFLFLGSSLTAIVLTLPSLDDVGSLFTAESSIITDRHGTELYRIHGDEDRTPVPLEQISRPFLQATIAIEDERFFERGCFDARAFLRAILGNITGGWRSQGGSTLTQQFAKNAFVGSRKTILRKVRELLLACRLEQRFTKEQLLELYVNRISFGSNIYGIEQAARSYFSRRAHDLSLAQAAVMAALPQRPSYFNPYGEHLHTTVSERILQEVRGGRLRSADGVPEDEIVIGLLGTRMGSGTQSIYVGGRADQVLRNMHAQGYITELEEREALEEMGQMTFQPARENIRAPHFVLWIRKLLEDQFDSTLLTQGGLTITTTIDWPLQQAAESVVGSYADFNADLYGAHNSALLSASTQSGEILAYVGNTDFWDELHEGKVDMVRAPRQPGSSFKPFVYATAFLRGSSPATVLYDVPTRFGEDQPENYDGTFWGPLTIRRALGASRNIPAVKTFFLAGGEEGILTLAASLGMPSLTQQRALLSQRRGAPYEYGWPLALGAGEVSLLHLTNGYLSLARGGSHLPLHAILRITDRNGGLVSSPSPPQGEQVLDSRIAYQITSILSDRGIRPNRFWQEQLSVPGTEAAAKTGTSNKCLRRSEEGECLEPRPDNNWTLGYTPSLVTGVWVGNASGGTLAPKADGLSTAARIWHDFMGRAIPLLPTQSSSFPVPSGLTQALISELSGKFPTECTPLELRRPEIFLAERVPVEPDDACQTLEVDRVTGHLASDACPPEARERRAFLILKGELPERFPGWAEDAHSWGEKAMATFEEDERGSGSFLPLPLTPTVVCDPSRTPGRLVRPTVRFLSPLDSSEVGFPSLTPEIAFTVGSSVREVSYSVNGKTVAQTNVPPFTPTLHLQRVAKEGMSVRLRVVLSDEYFNEAEDEVTVRLQRDRGAPTVSLLSPEEGDLLSAQETLVVRAEAHDDGGVERVRLFLDEVLLTTRRDPPFTFRYPLTEVVSGLHRLEVRAEDFAGNTSGDSITFTVLPAGSSPSPPP